MKRRLASDIDSYSIGMTARAAIAKQLGKRVDELFREIDMDALGKEIQKEINYQCGVKNGSDA